MKALSLGLVCLLALSGPVTVLADDITTISGKTYHDVHDVLIRGNLLTFTTETDVVKIPLADIPPLLKERYASKTVAATPTPAPAVTPSPDGPNAPKPGEKLPTTPHELVVSVANRCIQQIADNMKALPESGPVTLNASDAFSADKITEASRDALINGRPIAFFMIAAPFLNEPVDPKKLDAAGAFAQFFLTFKNSITPVFVIPSQDLVKLPSLVSDALKIPATVPAPRIVFTNADLSLALHDLKIPSETVGTSEREEATYAAVMSIKRWYLDLANSTH